MTIAGPLALIGGKEWRDGCSFDAALLDFARTEEVVVITAAAAYEHPERMASRAEEWFGALGARTVTLPVLQRADLTQPGVIETVRNARFIAFSDGSPLHLRSAIKDSSLWDALLAAWQDGAVVAGSAASATVLGDPMVDPRGGAFTLGLGLVRNLAVVPHWERWTKDKARRMTQLMPASTVVAEIEERTALVRWPGGRWEASGDGSVTLTKDHERLSLDALEAEVETATGVLRSEA